MAFGIDSVAHRAALDAGGLTLAVLGTPIDQIYPACHKELAEEIVEFSVTIFGTVSGRRC